MEIPPPPQRFLPVVEKAKDAYKKWSTIHRNIPRAERFGIGSRVDSLWLELLELLRLAAYTPVHEKIAVLERASHTLDSLRFFLQLAWETRLIPNEQYIPLGTDVEDIGRMVGGWRKGLLTKTRPII